MATSILKTGVSNYFINEDGSISMQYDPNFNRCFILNSGDSSKEIPMENIAIQKGGQIAFKYDNIKYIIDDGYRNRLVMAGYLDLKIKEEGSDFDYGPRIKSALMQSFKTLKFDSMYFHQNELMIENHSKSGYTLLIEIEPLDRMITRNIKRAEQRLPMYPTRQGFNRFKTLYFRIFAQKRFDAKKSLSLEELHFMAVNMIKAVATSKNLSFYKLDEITADHLKTYDIVEMKLEKTILKWEEDL